MKILTWNINGIRSSKVPLKELFDALDADVICLQETKVTRDQLDERTAVTDGYNSFFSFSRARSGYSGVATYVKESATPVRAEEGLSGILASEHSDQNIGCYGDQSSFTDEELHSLDKEGRALITQHRVMTGEGEEHLMTVINVYCPRADPEREERKSFKLRFYELLQVRAQALLGENSFVIVLGDINTSHKRIDHCEPDECEEFEERPDRKWLSQFIWDPLEGKQKQVLASGGDAANTSDEPNTESQINVGKFVDTFRYFHPTQKEAFTCWSTATGARTFNYGTRIDYIFADKELAQRALVDCVIMPEVQGSDHCPVKLTGHWAFLSSKKCPSSCTRYWPEFQGRQQKLSAFLVVGAKNNSEVTGSQNTLSKQGSKRPSSQTSLQLSKKTKVERSNSAVQSTLSSFIVKPKVKKEESKAISQSDLVSKSEFISQAKLAQCQKPVSQTLGRESPEISGVEQNSQEEPAKEGSEKLESVNLWKNLLKGPAPAPLCKGHQEPCVLRTVKKDGLNKGRRFYVCARPDGPRTNPNARCDHFEWILKKLKS